MTLVHCAITLRRPGPARPGGSRVGAQKGRVKARHRPRDSALADDSDRLGSGARGALRVLGVGWEDSLTQTGRGPASPRAASASLRLWAETGPSPRAGRGGGARRLGEAGERLRQPAGPRPQTCLVAGGRRAAIDGGCGSINAAPARLHPRRGPARARLRVARRRG